MSSWASDGPPYPTKLSVKLDPTATTMSIHSNYSDRLRKESMPSKMHYYRFDIAQEMVLDTKLTTNTNPGTETPVESYIESTTPSTTTPSTTPPSTTRLDDTTATFEELFEERMNELRRMATELRTMTTATATLLLSYYSTVNNHHGTETPIESYVEPPTPSATTRSMMWLDDAAPSNHTLELRESTKRWLAVMPIDANKAPTDSTAAVTVYNTLTPPVMMVPTATIYTTVTPPTMTAPLTDAVISTPTFETEVIHMDHADVDHADKELIITPPSPWILSLLLQQQKDALYSITVFTLGSPHSPSYWKAACASAAAKPKKAVQKMKRKKAITIMLLYYPPPTLWKGGNAKTVSPKKTVRKKMATAAIVKSSVEYLIPKRRRFKCRCHPLSWELDVHI
jgi:hypothetical protein